MTPAQKSAAERSLVQLYLLLCIMKKFEWTLSELSKLLYQPQHRLIYICEKGVIVPDHSVLMVGDQVDKFLPETENCPSRSAGNGSTETTNGEKKLAFEKSEGDFPRVRASPKTLSHPSARRHNNLRSLWCIDQSNEQQKRRILWLCQCPEEPMRQ